jgi:hypothetical protein
MGYSNNQLRDMSTLFTRSEVARWLKSDFSSIDIKLDRYGLNEKYKGKSYLTILKNAYSQLKREYPNEYIVKNEFLNRYIRKELGTDNSIIYSEFRIGKAIADLAMFNGVSKVFEIKTALDKEYRLSNQILEYKKVFNEVYIIVPITQLEKYVNYDLSVGILCYDSKWDEFSLVRRAKQNFLLDRNTLMEVLHTNEYKEVVRSFYKTLPEMNSFNQFEACKELIVSIPDEILNGLFIDLMKKRNKENSFFNRVNDEFNQLCLALNLSKPASKQMIQILRTNLL